MRYQQPKQIPLQQKVSLVGIDTQKDGFYVTKDIIVKSSPLLIRKSRHRLLYEQKKITLIELREREKGYVRS